MRHLWSFLAGLVVAPLAWILIALGQDGSARTVTGWAEVGTFSSANLIQSAVYLAVAGLLLGLLGTLRVSPLGPLAAGLLLVSPHIGLFVNPFAVRDALPADWSLFGDPLPLVQPLDNGTMFLIGALLLMATFSAKRWRRWPAPAATATNPQPSPASDADEPTRTDWSALSSGLPELDVAPPTLGYPDSAPSSPPPAQRREGASPWSAPPRSATNRDGTS